MALNKMHPVDHKPDFDHGVSQEEGAATRLLRIFLWLSPWGCLFASLLLWSFVVQSGTLIPRAILITGIVLLNLIVIGTAGVLEGMLRWRGEPGKIAAGAVGFLVLHLTPVILFLW